jgi:1,4-alpha-glucan branching enzyme
MKTTTSQMKATKRLTFHYSTHDASSVLLVGDFTNWQERPIPMHKRNGDAWTATVELQPGPHHYRFIVDGEWHDDPDCTVRVPNPFGSQDMVTQVA